MDEKLVGKKVSAISLGCDKNRVDLEKMLFALSDYGFEIVADVADAQIVIVNTCAFITPSKEEALSNIFEMCALKENGVIEKVIVSGCLAQRHKKELEQQIPEVDAFLDAKESENICTVVEGLYGVKRTNKKPRFGRIFTSRGAYAYLKIAEGCSNACSFCTIPRIKGRYTSYDMDALVDEAKMLAKNGARELILVAQDVSRYGEDLYGQNKLIELCKRLCKISGIEWIRLHYLYPEKIDDQFLDFLRSESKMCKYLDIPLQHISTPILSSMRRRMDENSTRELVKKLGDFAVRTTFIVGYPNEKRKDFALLCNFLEQARFDYAGFFPYYREENTPSYYMKHQKLQHTKNVRLKKVQKIQNSIATEKAKQRIGQKYTTLVDYFDELQGNFVGHTEFLSPTVDFGVEIVDNNNVSVGDFVNVEFLDFDGQNFKAKIVEDLPQSDGPIKVDKSAKRAKPDKRKRADKNSENSQKKQAK